MLSPNRRQTFQQELIDLDLCKRARVSFFLIFPLLRFCLFPPHPTGQHCRLRRQPVGDLLPGERRGNLGPERSLPGAAEGVGTAPFPENNTGQEPSRPSLHNIEYLEKRMTPLLCYNDCHCGGKTEQMLLNFRTKLPLMKSSNRPTSTRLSSAAE